MKRVSMLVRSAEALASYALLREARASQPTLGRRGSASTCIARQDELARSLRAGTISHVAWHDEVDQLADEMDVAQLLADIHRAKLTEHARFMHDPVKRGIDSVDEHGKHAG